MDCLDCGAVLVCSKCDENAGSCDCTDAWFCPICDREEEEHDEDDLRS